MEKSVVKNDLISIRIDSKTKQTLTKIAKGQGRSLSNFMQQVALNIANNKIKLPF